MTYKPLKRTDYDPQNSVSIHKFLHAGYRPYLQSTRTRKERTFLLYISDTSATSLRKNILATESISWRHTIGRREGLDPSHGPVHDQ